MDRKVETLRGLACILLVFYHVIGDSPSTGLRIDHGALRWFNDGLAYLRMPLFTVLSGLVYGFRPFSGSSQTFLLGKARRLLVPMLVVGTFFAFMQTMVPGTNAEPPDWRLLHIEPVAHFWFVESLFWIFVWVWLLEYLKCLDHGRAFALVYLGAALVYLTVPGSRWLSIGGAIYLLPYFLTGLAVTRFSWRDRLSHPGLRTILLALAFFAAFQLGWPVSRLNGHAHAGWLLIASLSFCGFFISLNFYWRWLARVGSSSYPIYIFHVFFTAAARIALEKSGATAIPVFIGAGLLLGLGGPMLVEYLASQNRWSSLLLLGKAFKFQAETAPKPIKSNV